MATKCGSGGGGAVDGDGRLMINDDDYSAFAEMSMASDSTALCIINS